eukprot:TRINITY_DN11354_c0_g1_i2.p1 TRINITY_DN11354_c0_g1~~TRINITY_DN11354_c0_g1_i2.p1  ORF type:complete len:534 (+),score=95.66 TRINITY_DN11354_c0_g1_i2:75-1676(+)
MKRSKRQSADCHDSDDERDTPAPKSSNRVVVYRWRWDSDSESESETRNDSRYFWQQPGWRDEEWQQEDGTWMAQDSRPCSFELLNIWLRQVRTHLHWLGGFVACLYRSELDNVLRAELLDKLLNWMDSPDVITVDTPILIKMVQEIRVLTTKMAEHNDADCPIAAFWDRVAILLKKFKRRMARGEVSDEELLELEQSQQKQASKVDRLKRALSQANAKWSKAKQHLDRLSDEHAALKKCLQDAQTACLVAATDAEELAKKSRAEVINAIFQQPVSKLNEDQTGMLMGALTNRYWWSRHEENELNGRALVDVSAADLTALISPFGLCHRVVHCAKMAADVPRPGLLETDFNKAVEALSAWLANSNHRLITQYKIELSDARLDAITCASLSTRDLGDIGIRAGDRGPLLKLLVEASRELAPDSIESQEADVSQDAVLKLRHEQTEQRRQFEEQLTCPISMELMADPVLAEDGHVYERDAITNWLEKKGTSPMTQAVIGKTLQPIPMVKHLIEVHKAHQLEDIGPGKQSAEDRTQV